MERKPRIRVAVVFGGRGPEHAVSCLGAGNVLRAIDRNEYEVIPIGITRDGSWLEVADDPGKLAITSGDLPSVESVAKPDAHVVPWAYQGDSAVVSSAAGHIPHVLGDVDVVLPVLHGPYGEDGTIQGLLELAGVPYVGSGVLASAVSMDKEYMKLIFAAKGLPVGPHAVVRERDWPPNQQQRNLSQQRVTEQLDALGWPLFVKPARGGSSLGTTKAHDPAELAQAIALAREYDPKVLVETAITAREIEVAVLQGIDGAPPDTSLPGELRLPGDEEFYDFEAKYLASSEMLIPAPIPAADRERIREMAAIAFDAVSAEGLARADFFYQPNGQILINEINTFPGMSPTSYFQKMWEATGVSFPEVIDRLLRLALARKPGLR